MNDKVAIVFDKYPEPIFKAVGDTYNAKDDLKNAGMWWNPAYKIWYSKVTPDNFLKLKTQFEQNFKVIIPVSYNYSVSPQKVQPSVQKKEVKPPVISPVFPEGSTPLAHQADVLKTTLSDPNKRIWHCDMGTGKSYMSLALALSLKTQLFVVVPANLKETFYNETIKFGLKPFLFGSGYTKEYKKYTWEEADVLITSYAYLTKVHKNHYDKIQGKLVVYDECQYLKKYSAQRTRTALEIANDFRKNGKEVIFMTGTLITGKPVDAYNVLRTIAGWKVTGSWKDFATKFNGGYQGQFGWVNSKKGTNLKELASIMDKYSIRITKEQVLDLKGKTRSKLNSTRRVSFDGCYNQGEHIVFYGDYKRALAESKVPVTATHALGSRQAVIFSAYIDVMNAIKAEILKKDDTVRVEVINKDTKGHLKAQYVKEFQEGKINYLVGGYGSMSRGVTLTASNISIMNDLHYPEETLQAEDRIYRHGQSLPVNIYYVVNERDEYDVYLYDNLLVKLNNISQINNEPELVEAYKRVKGYSGAENILDKIFKKYMC